MAFGTDEHGALSMAITTRADTKWQRTEIVNIWSESVDSVRCCVCEMCVCECHLSIGLMGTSSPELSISFNAAETKRELQQKGMTPNDERRTTEKRDE